MLTYKVTSQESRVIDGLGVFTAEVPRLFTYQEAEWFRRLRGVPLLGDNLPEGTELTIIVEEV